MKSNRFLAGITASVLLMTATFTELPFCNPLPSAAVDTDVSLDTSQISVSSANSLGEMISEEVEAQQKELEESSGNLIREVEMYDNIARVMFTAQESCTVVVGIYSEDEIRMYGCGVMEVDAEQTEITVPINLDVMPEYYLVKAFLTDTETKAPISPAYYNDNYTKVMVEFFATEIGDFDVPESQLLVFDENKTVADNPYNFAVFSDSTVIFESDGTQNVLTNNGDDTYTVQNPSDGVAALQAGQTAAFRNVDGSFEFLKIAECTADGDTVILKKDELEPQEIFRFFRLEADGAMEQAEEPEAALPSRAGIRAGDNDDFTMEIYPEIHLEPECSIYIPGMGQNSSSNTESNDSFQVKLQIDYFISATLHFEKEFVNLEVPIGIFRFDVVPGMVYVQAEPCLNLKVEGEGEIKIGMSGTEGFEATNRNIQSLYKEPEPTFECEGELRVFFGLSLKPSIGVLCKDFLSLEFEPEIGWEISVTRSMLTHYCPVCYNLKVALLMNFEVELTFLKFFKLSVETSKSFAEDNAYWSSKLGFGWGECPYADEDLEPGTVPDDSGDSGDYSDEGLPENPKVGPLVFIPDDPKTDDSIEYFYCNHSLNGSDYAYLATPDDSYQIQRANIVSSIDGIPVKSVSFFGCPKLSSIRIPSTAKKVSISNCEQLTSVQLSEGSCSDTVVIQNCTSLESISIPDSVYEISDYAFKGCKNLKSVILSSNLEYLGRFVFNGCRALTDIEIPDTIETIQMSCFNGCTDLESVTIPMDAPLSKIDIGVFGNCKSLKTFTVPSNVTEIGRLAFDECITLKDIEFSKSVTTICSNAFKNCDALEAVKLPENLRTMETGIFEGCDALQNVIFPPTIYIIPSNTFYNCDKLEEIVIPDTIIQIDAWAFRHCDSLKSVTILNPQTEFGENIFSECDKNAITIYGYSGSTAESYAKNNRIPFVALDAEDDGEGSDDQAPDDDTPIQPDTPNEDEPEEITPITKTFTGLTPNTIYNFYVTEQVPDSETGEETILYITQGTADENGEWTVSYYPSAETEEEGFVVPFKAEDEGNAEDQTIPGDVNGDGVLDISDAIFLARFVAEDSTLDMSNFNVQNADINGDGLTSAADTVYIIRKIAKLI